ncbi:MAG: murein biosynthesis integral membrane protein MurJ [Austwickia sp.]|nr:murein biosynthesis integral membrane protein MurJ [Austwickia sp.]
MTEQTTTRTQSVARASAVLASGSLVSRILGVVRTSMLFAIFSNTTAGDTWQVANAIPNMIFLLLAGGVVNAVLVPQITKAERRGADGERYVDTLITVGILIMAVATAIFLPLTPYLVRLFASDRTWDDAAFQLSNDFALICLPAVFFYGLYAILGQLLNARSRFGAYTWAPVLCNIVWIAGLLAYHLNYRDLGAKVTDWSSPMVRLIAGTMTLGVAAQALVLLVPLWRDGFRLRPRLKLRGIGLRSAGEVAAWTFAAVVIAQLGVIVQAKVLTSVDSGYAGKLGFDTAYLLFMTPHGLVTVSLITALYTGMAKAATAGDDREVGRDLRRGLRMIGVTTIPVAIATLAFGAAVIRLVFPANSLQATDAITYVAWALIVALPWYGFFALAQRTFYAYEDGKTPFQLQVVSTAVATVIAVACYLLPSAYRAVGVALGQSAAALLTAGLCVGLLRARMRDLVLFDVVRVHVRAAVACLPGAVLGYALFLLFQAIPGGLLGALLTLLTATPVFLVSYVAAARRMRVHEVDLLLRPVRSRLTRFLARGERDV